MIIVVCGVAGCGKSTIGKELANKLNFEFADADDYHSKENVELMRSGVGLNDTQRHDWLLKLRQVCEHWHASQRGGVLACSALKAIYRHFLSANIDYTQTDEQNRGQMKNLDLRFVLLDCSEELIRRRLAERTNHYFNPGLIRSQFQTIERPSSSSGMMIDGVKAYCEHHQNIADAFYYMIVVQCKDDVSSPIMDQVMKIISDLESIKTLS